MRFYRFSGLYTVLCQVFVHAENLEDAIQRINNSAHGKSNWNDPGLIVSPEQVIHHSLNANFGTASVFEIDQFVAAKEEIALYAMKQVW